jgi:hypothetical protein
MMGRRRWLACLVLLVAGCSGSGTATTVSQSGSSTSSDADSSTTTTRLVGLRPELLEWVAPLDFEETVAGWEAFGLPDQQPKYLAMADCWEQHGYEEFARHVRDQASVRPESSANILLTPMRRLEEVGFAEEPDFWVGSIVESAGPMGMSGSVETQLKYGPDLGLSPDDAVGIRKVGAMCWPEGGWIPTRGMGRPAATFSDQWITRLGEVDQEPELAALIGDTVTPCLRAIDPYFSDAINPEDWLSKAAYAPQDPQDVEGYASEMWAMPEDTLVAWGQAFAGCMNPLEEARRAPRLAAREAWVNKWHDELIDFQTQTESVNSTR